MIVNAAVPMSDRAFRRDDYSIVTIGYDHPAQRHHNDCSDWFAPVNLAYDHAIAAGAKCPAFAVFQPKHPVVDVESFRAVRACGGLVLTVNSLLPPHRRHR